MEGAALERPPFEFNPLTIKVANEWADDTHTLGLTKKGMELYLQEEEE